MDAFNWGSFTVRIPVNASIEKLYWCWATRAGMEYWFLRLSEYRKQDGSLRNEDEFVQQSDTYNWLWHGWGDDTVELGTILACNGKDFLKFSFGKAGNCAVTIKEEAAQTIVELVQDEIPSDERGMQYYHVGCKTGWTFYFTNLKSLLEGGVDLLNRNADLKNVINS
jgi:uncharacterized protein YndB with AHSA1/START domain